MIQLLPIDKYLWYQKTRYGSRKYVDKSVEKLSFTFSAQDACIFSCKPIDPSFFAISTNVINHNIKMLRSVNGVAVLDEGDT